MGAVRELVDELIVASMAHEVIGHEYDADLLERAAKAIKCLSVKVFEANGDTEERCR